MSANPRWPVPSRPVLDAPTADAVRRLAASAAEHDGAEALSEHSRLHLQTPGSTHLLGYGGPSGDALAGYAQVWEDGSAELVVAPASRRQGVGSRLWSAALLAGAGRVWAHGDLEAAKRFAGSLELVPTRELHLMGRPLTEDDAAPVDLPSWVTVETYADRDDPAEWVALNAAAFASHPEQGRLTVEDFAARAGEPWFDPAGLLYLIDADAPPEAPPIAFHWTKADPEEATRGEPRRGWAPGSETSGARGGTGEVYALGIHPAYQGRGLAGPLTRLGTAYLARQGMEQVVLYVDGDNERALRTYRAEGLEDLAVDVVYSPGEETVRMEA